MRGCFGWRGGNVDIEARVPAATRAPHTGRTDFASYAGAALDANVDAVIVGRMTASADHPVALAFPEGDYLKGLLVRRR